MKRSLAAIWILLLSSACQTTPALDSDKSCEDQLNQLANQESTVRVVEKTKTAGGYVLSYSAAAAGYVTDVAVIVTGGVVTSVVNCSPHIMAWLATGVAVITPCYRFVDNKKWMDSHVGQDIERRTAGMRKPDYLPISHAIRQTSACFAARGDRASRGKAADQLRALTKSDIYGDVPEGERKVVEAELTALGI